MALERLPFIKRLSQGSAVSRATTVRADSWKSVKMREKAANRVFPVPHHRFQRYDRASGGLGRGSCQIELGAKTHTLSYDSYSERCMSAVCRVWHSFDAGRADRNCQGSQVLAALIQE